MNTFFKVKFKQENRRKKKRITLEKIECQVSRENRKIRLHNHEDTKTLFTERNERFNL